MLISDWKRVSQEKNIPAILRPWLEHAGSMTCMLEEASGVEAQIVIQNEGWQLPWEDESQFLENALSSCGGKQRSPCWIREVVIITRQPVMFARSVFSHELIDQFPELMSLGAQPLGRTIFKDNVFQRGFIEVTEISMGQPLWEEVPSSLRPEKCWARRSLFHSSICPFLLSEVFLPYVTTL